MRRGGGGHGQVDDPVTHPEVRVLLQMETWEDVRAGSDVF